MRQSLLLLCIWRGTPFGQSPVFAVSGRPKRHSSPAAIASLPHRRPVDAWRSKPSTSPAAPDSTRPRHAEIAPSDAHGTARAN